MKEKIREGINYPRTPTGVPGWQGELVNRHDTVMRLNNAPTLGYEAYVGNFTTHRLINNKWAAAYGTPVSKLQRLPLEWNVSAMVEGGASLPPGLKSTTATTPVFIKL